MKTKGNIIIALILCVILVIYGSYFIKNQQKLASEHFNASEKKLRQTIRQEAEAGKYQEVNSTTADDELIFLMPTDGQTVIKDVQDDMTKLAESTGAAKDKKGPTKTVLTATAKTLQENIIRYEYVQKSYHWDKQEQDWDITHHKTTNHTLINRLTGRKLTLGDVFTNQQNLLKLQRNIQEDLLASAKDRQQAVDAILALPSLLASQTNFTYGESQVTLHYEQKDSYITDYSISYDQVGRFLNPDFVDSHYLKETPVETFTPKEKIVALTFDDGPSDKTTPSILAILKKKKVPATFFMLGQQVEKFPEIVKDMADQGHELANHSYSHPNLTDLSTEETRQQINQTQGAIYKASGILPRYVRPPYGNFNYETAVAIGLPLVNWSVDSLDWKSKDSKKIIAQIKTTTGPDSIILMHDIHQETAAALETLITDLQKDGYQFVTVSDLLQVTANPLTTYYSASNQRDIAKE